MSTISFTVSFQGVSQAVSLPSTTPLSHLFSTLAALTSVPQDLQKLLVRGKSLTLASAGEKTLADAGVRDGARVMLVGSTLGQLEALQGKEREDARRERVMRERKTGKVRATGTSSSASPALQYRFHALSPLSHLPNPASALALLERLASDPAIVHLLHTHRFAIGLLTELAPHEHPELLGLNENAGEKIKLRLRTDAYDGFRLYADVRRVLVHELTHCVWGEHDDNFKKLNSEMNREVAAFELSQRQNTHTFRPGEVYEPTPTERDAQQYVLGGGASGGTRARDGALELESVEERRRRVLDAAVRRAEREEEELEGMCGSGGAGAGAGARAGAGTA